MHYYINHYGKPSQILIEFSSTTTVISFFVALHVYMYTSFIVIDFGVDHDDLGYERKRSLYLKYNLLWKVDVLHLIVLNGRSKRMVKYYFNEK